MSTKVHKHLKLDQKKLDKAKTILQVRTESEAVSVALDVIVAEQEIRKAWKEVQGQGTLKKVFK
jgi:hypothetical protein